MNQPGANVLQIRTPEGIVFPLYLASPVLRFFAWGIDLACIALLSYFSGVGLGWMGLIDQDLAAGVMTLAYFAISLAYPITLEWYWRGQTLGKRLLSLQVVDAQGLRLQVSQVMIRNLLRFIDGLPVFYVVGGLAALFSRKGQRLGDLAANTLVIRRRKPLIPDVNQLLAGKYNSLREFPHLIARLRQRLDPVEIGILVQALLRRNHLTITARVKLYRELADYYRAKVKFPSRAMRGLSDEQYLRNIADVIFTAAKPVRASRPTAGNTKLF